MKYNNDTIAAQSTVPGTAAIHIIRVSGSQAIKECDQIFKGGKPLVESTNRLMTFGRIYDDKQMIDEVLVTVFHAPASYTGEDMVEIYCHGNQYISERILELLLQKMRLAEPGEFTQRAYINGKLDLTQAEAVGDLLTSSTRYSHQLAVEQLEGRLHSRIKQYLDQLVDLRTRLELEIDFPEEHEGELSFEELNQSIDQLYQDLERLVASGREGMILRQGVRICLVGAPNVGKSSIFNSLLESERAIVTSIPGTTRDFLEEAFSLQGFLIRIYDTAGLRESDNEVEQIGINRSRELINKSDLIIYVSDAESADEAIPKEEINSKKVIKVINKCDLLSIQEIKTYADMGYIPCSVLQKDGLAALKSKILSEINIDVNSMSETPLTNLRQIACARKALEEISRVKASLADGVSIEFIAFDLQQASQALEQITGEISNDEILDQIFSNYCIGK